MGRPPRSAEPTKNHTICLTDSEWALLKKLAAEQSVSPGVAVARLLRQPKATTDACRHEKWRLDSTGKNVCAECGVAKNKRA